MGFNGIYMQGQEKYQQTDPSAKQNQVWKAKMFPFDLRGGSQIVPTSGGEGVKQKKKKKHFILTNLQITIFSLRNKNWTLFLNKIFSRFISSIYKR